MYQRQFFNVSTDTGSWVDTGPSFHGEIAQMAWSPSTADTGADLMLSLVPAPGGDTGDSWEFFNDNDCLGVDFMKVPTQFQHGSDGNVDPADTGSQVGVPVVAAGDRLRVKVVPGGSAVAGKLFIWVKD
jgi:hypothetical protein